MLLVLLLARPIFPLKRLSEISIISALTEYYGYYLNMNVSIWKILNTRWRIELAIPPTDRTMSFTTM